MRMAQILFFISFVIIALLSDCTSTTVVRTGLPPPRTEGVAVAPSPRYVWVAGRYRVAPRRSHTWVLGYWKATSRRGQVWVKGYWR